MTSDISPESIGALIRETRRQRGLTQAQLAQMLKTSQSAIGRIEAGNQNLSLETINRLAAALSASLLLAGTGQLNYVIEGGRPLEGRIETRLSKNGAVAVLCASLLNRGRTTLRGVPQIEEVNRLTEVLTSIGVACEWDDSHTDLTLTPPERLSLSQMDRTAARRTRSILMFLGPLLHHQSSFIVPYAGGCDLGTRTVEPHLQALRHLGLSVVTRQGFYHCEVAPPSAGCRQFALTERGDTVTENALMAAARTPGTTVIRNASPNYMVQDLCAYLVQLGVAIEGIGTTTLTVHGVADICADAVVDISEDPIEAMSLLTAGIVTGSELTVTRAPIEFLEIELAVLESMGLDFDLGEEYCARNGFTRLADLTVRPSVLRAPADKIHPMPFPGLNIDNLPFFAVIAAAAEGTTTIFDWVYDNRATHLLELNKLGANIKLLDPHRLMVTGPTHWHGDRQIICPPALRPAMCLLLAALAAEGTTVLRDTYVINRGYEGLPERLSQIGAKIEATPFETASA
ncbi:MAG: UDP-N-acetylglucosamine 1-carboxyvinyltransferase [Propionibacteriaceae bacterium]|jgi:UDP-N-acetylglucosamine 1-carboxyvinyltransferase|nr:UDP-N-acetylglucosamine 1-carboxyvinyltransferase [Propionibacteriaceae bacterium]